MALPCPVLWPRFRVLGRLPWLASASASSAVWLSLSLALPFSLRSVDARDSEMPTKHAARIHRLQSSHPPVKYDLPKRSPGLH